MPAAKSFSTDLLRELVVRARDQLAARRVDDVVREDLALEVIRRNLELLDLRLLELADVLHRDPAVFLDHDLAADLDVEARRLAAQALGHELERDRIAELELVPLEEEVEDLLVREVERAKNDTDRQLAAAVDADEHGVLRVELEVEPRAAIRNHARGEQQLAGRVRLALVVVEEHARRAVQLRHDHALGAVDHERAVVGHQRHFAEIDLLLADVLDLLLRARGFLVVDHQPHEHAQRRGIREAAQPALLDVEDGIAEAIAHVLERRVARVAHDREHAAKRRVQSHLGALGRRDFLLQELLIRIDLNRKEIGDAQDAWELPEILSNALLFSERIRHACCSDMFGDLGLASENENDACAAKCGGVRLKLH